MVADAVALSARGLSIADLQGALERNNRNDGAGRLSENEESLLVRSEGSIRTLEDVRAIVVATRDSVPVRVGDVATVRVGALTRYGLVNKDGAGEAVEGLVVGLKGANAREVVQQVRARLAQIQQTLPQGAKIVPFYDRSQLIERAVHTVTKALEEASILVLVLLFVFLGQLRAALVVAIILPLSALATFVAMRLYGLSANLMSLGGLAIAIGLLVDAAVVVVENIEARGSQLMKEGGSRRHVIFRCTQEVALPVVSGIAIIIIVFLPLLSLQGLEGKLFAPVALTIVFALAASLVLSLTIIPVLASFILAHVHPLTPRYVRWIEERYSHLLAWTLQHELIVYPFALASLVLAIVLFMFTGKSFLPTMDEGDLVLQLEKVPSVNLTRSSEADRAIQKRILEKVPEVSQIVSRVGADELGLDPMGVNETDTFLALKPRDQWRVPDKDWIIDQVRQVSAEYAGINFSFTQPIDMRVAEMISGVRADLTVKIFGPDLQQLDSLAQQIAVSLREIRGSQDVVAVANQGVQYLQVEIDRMAAGRAGLSVEAIQGDLRTLVEGRSVGVVLEEGRRLPLLVRGDAPLQMSSDVFQQVRLPLQDKPPVPLEQVARLIVREGPLKVDRENSMRMSVVRANVRGRDLVGFVAEAQRRAASSVKLPSGYHLAWGGQFENQRRTAARLAVVVPAALGLIFLILFATLGTVRQAVLVFANIPFALIGGVFALAITGEYLSVPASVGFIALMGIAVLNGLVMVTHFNQLSAKSTDLRTVVLSGARRRLRPVLMTASITAMGLVPVLFATGPGSEIQRPLAIVVIGGLVSSTLLTLALLPSLFHRFGLRSQS